MARVRDDKDWLAKQPKRDQRALLKVSYEFQADPMFKVNQYQMSVIARYA